MIVTPGYTFSLHEEVTEEKLNQLGAPTVAIEAGDKAAILADITAGNENLLVNPDLSQWTRGNGPVACPVMVKTLLADNWWVRVRYDTAIPGSPSPPIEATYLRESVTGSALQMDRARFGYSVGAFNEFGDIEFGQDWLSRLTAAGTSAGFTLAVDLENQTGSAFTPKARFYSCNTKDDFSATTARVTVNGTAETGSSTLGNGERRVFLFRFTSAALAGVLHTGGELALVIPETVSTAGYCRVYGIVKAEIGQTATARAQERESTPAAAATAAGESGMDYFRNGEFSPALFVANGGNVACAVATALETGVAYGWTVINSAGSFNTSRDTATLPNTETGAALKFTGDATATAAVQLRQKIYRAEAVTARRGLRWQAQVRNGTGAALVPTLVVKTCDNVDDFGALTQRLSQTLTSIGNGDWLRESVALDVDTFTNAGNGFVVELNFPANSLDGSGKTIRVAQASLTVGSTDADWVRAPGLPQATEVGRTRNLLVEHLGSNAVTITADEAVLVAVDGSVRHFGAVSTSLDLDSAGVQGLDTGTPAAGMYHFWLLGNDDGVKCIGSLSSTLPTGIGAYPWRLLISSVAIQSSTTLPVFHQRNGTVRLLGAAVLSHSSALTADGDWHAATIANLPARAIAVEGTAGTATAGKNLHMALAPDSTGASADGIGVVVLDAGLAAAFAPPGTSPVYVTAAYFRVGIRTANTLYYACKSGTAATFTFGISAYELAP